MVDVRISRQSGEVFGDANNSVAVGRVDVEVAGLTQQANSVDQVMISRISAEVFAKPALLVDLTRVDVEVAGLAQAPNTADQVMVSRMSAEVFANATPRVVTTRVDVEIAGLAQGANTADQVKVSRISGECFARRGSAGPVSPLPVNPGAEVFLHDWADNLVLRSSYLTDVESSNTGAESRLGLRLKPARSMDLVWRQTLNEYDAGDLSRLDRLYVFLRKLTDDRFPVPLYCDQRVLETAYLSTDDTLFFDASHGRWFTGARVAVVQLTHTGSYSSHSLHILESVQSDHVVFDAPLGVDVRAYSIILPLMDCEITLETEMLQEHGCLAEVTLTVNEVPGASALPATKADTPAGAPTHRGIPIFNIEPDWASGIRRRRSRQGAEFSAGRGRAVAPEASRSREVHELNFTNERASYWQIVQFFDTRRGRLRDFWHIDQEQIWTASVLATGSIQLEPFGVFADFEEELEGGLIGLFMSDGSYHVRDVSSVNDLGVTYQVLLTPDLPALSAANVVRIARARAVRFDSDEMEETWAHAGLASTQLRIIETLEEKDVVL